MNHLLYFDIWTSHNDIVHQRKQNNMGDRTSTIINLMGKRKSKAVLYP